LIPGRRGSGGIHIGCSWTGSGFPFKDSEDSCETRVNAWARFDNAGAAPSLIEWGENA
jgi:hypothetical protein